MSVRGEFRRLLGDLLATLRDAGLAAEGSEAALLEPLLERAGDDLTGCAEDTLVLLPRLDRDALHDASLRRRFDAAFERLEAVCQIILGR